MAVVAISQGGRFGTRSRASRATSLVLTIGLHLLLLAGGLAVWRQHGRTLVAEAPLVVDLLPLASPPEPVREMDPGPVRVERNPPKAHLEATVPPIVQAPAAVPVLANELITPAIVDPGPAIPATSAPQIVAAPAATRLSGRGEQNWEARLLAHLQQFRRYPARARAARQQGTAYLQFTMNREGRVLSARILRGSGFATLDQAALDTLQRAQPLPAIPDDRPDVIELSIPVEFYLGR